MTTPIEPLAETVESDEARAPARDVPVSADDETFLADGPPAAGAGELAGPTKIGRYVFLDYLGAGGMGVVVAAYDPALDRKVAIKLIHVLRGDDHERRLRMEREAQAMAKLSHPNVVTVYEVGEHEGKLFLAMEFVQGQDLRGWLRAREADWRSVLDVFMQAGQGLAAAHRAGLVHRDFKPANVFVGDDGRVRVGDFGLARQDTGADAETVTARAQAQVPADATALARELTATGATLGTPAYMAPEQFAGEPTDARTDQFSFCVALWEALYGERPFAAPTIVDLAANVTTGRRRPPPPGRSVPVWLRRVLERGLSTAPAQRFPTVEALLAALRADPTRRRRWLAAAACAVLAIAGGAAVPRWLAAQQVAACEAEGASIAEVWNDAVQRSLHDGLLATGVDYAGTTAERVMPYFSAQAAAWRQGRTEACLRARVRGSWDEDMLGRSVWCLDERRMELAALVDEYSQASTASVQNAVTAAATLSQVEPCLDPGRLARLPPPPADRAGAQAVQALLLRAGAKDAAGAHDDGLRVVEDAQARAEVLAWPPLVAAARSRHGALLARAARYSDAEEALADAYFQAAEVGAWEVAAFAAQEMIGVVGLRQARHGEGRLWSRHADTALTLLGVDAQSPVRADVLNRRGLVDKDAGSFEAARAAHERALQIRETALGPDHPRVAGSLNNLALVHDAMGRHAEAMALFRRALAIFEKALGPDHPHVAGALVNMASVHKAMGEYDEATALYEQALTRMEQALGPDHPDLAVTLANLAGVYVTVGRYEDARAPYERTLAIAEKVLGPDHPHVAAALTGLAEIHMNTGEPGAAEPMYERVLAIWTKVLGPDHPEFARALNNLAIVRARTGKYAEVTALHERALAIQERALGPDHADVATSLDLLASAHEATGRLAEAKVFAERALAIWERTLGPDHPDLAYPLTTLATVARAEHRAADAVALAGRAVDILEKQDTSAVRLAQTRFVLAGALWDAPRGGGRDRERATALARQALDVLRAENGRDRLSAEIEAFLRRAGEH